MWRRRLVLNLVFFDYHNINNMMPFWAFECPRAPQKQIQQVREAKSPLLWGLGIFPLP